MHERNTSCAEYYTNTTNVNLARYGSFTERRSAMSIDRMLIICSLVELTYFGCSEGVACYSPFQWTTLALLALKLILVIKTWKLEQ
jgi:hypothetical protein